MKNLKYVNTHVHSSFSLFDAIGYPEQYINYALSREADAIAFTEHGNANSYPHYFLKTEKLNKQGVKFKSIPGVEAYFVDSLKDWNNIYQAERAKKKLENKSDKDNKDNIIADTLVYEEEGLEKVIDIDPIKQKNHIVLLARHQAGTQNLFSLISKSYKEGFYRYPRIDLDYLKQYGEGLVCLTGCLAGPFASRILKMTEQQKSFDEIQSVIYNLSCVFEEIFKRDCFYYEIQFNRLPQQHIVNQHLISLSKQTGIKLVATNDAHYPEPQLWKERELYRKLSPKFSSFSKDGCLLYLPDSVDMLECELYPKDGNATFEAYKHYCNKYDFYDDETIIQSIENSWHIAHDVIGEITYDKTVKLPSHGKDEFKQLVDLCITRLKDKELDKKPEYVERLKHELKVIKDKKFERYFLTLYKGVNKIRNHMLIGVGRGSGAGSLVNYLLEITQVDPIYYGLIFERFINPTRCLHPQTLCITEEGVKQIKDVSVKDRVLTGMNRYKDVKHIYKSKRKKLLKIKFKDTHILCSENHRWIVLRDNKIQEVYACDLKKTDKLLLKKQE